MINLTVSVFNKEEETMYVIMNMCDKVYYKETINGKVDVWTHDINKAKQFKSANDAYHYTIENEMFDILIVEV